MEIFDPFLRISLQPTVCATRWRGFFFCVEIVEIVHLSMPLDVDDFFGVR